MTYLNGDLEWVVADRIAASQTRSMPLPYYEFYEEQKVIRRLFAHSLRGEPEEFPQETDPGLVVGQAKGGARSGESDNRALAGTIGRQPA